MNDSSPWGSGALRLPLLSLGAVAYALLHQTLDPSAQLVYLGIFIIFAASSINSRTPAHASFWILGYLLFSTVGRGLSLTSLHQKDAAIYRLVGTSSTLNEQVDRSVQLNLIAVLAFVVAHSLTRSGSTHTWPVHHCRLDLGRPNWFLAWAVLGAACLLLPFEIANRKADDITAGGTFIAALPGYTVIGISVAVVIRLAQKTATPTSLIVGLAVYNTARLVLLGSKFGILAVVLGLVITVYARPKSSGSRRGLRLGRNVCLAAASLASIFVFSVPVLQGSSASVSTEDRLGAGANAFVSRSYGLDAEIASRVWIETDDHDYLYGSSFAAITYSGVPRQLWPDKPKAFSEWFGETVFNFSPQSGDRFFSPSFTGEWLLNFGQIGVVFGWLLFGCAARLSERLADAGIRTVVIIGLVHLVEGGMVTQFWLTAPLVAGAFIIRGIVRHGKDGHSASRRRVAPPIGKLES